MEDIEKDSSSGSGCRMSKHLERGEIERFLSISDFSDDNIRLLGRVNGHLLNCERCWDIFKLYKAIYRL